MAGRGGKTSRAAPRRKLVVRKRTLSAGELALVLVRSPSFGWAALIAAGFSLLSTLVMWWSTAQPMLASGQTARETLLARVDVELIDDSRTAFERDNARRQEPRVFQPDEKAIRAIMTRVRGLPELVGSANTLAEVSGDDRRRFSIDQGAFDVLRSALGPAGEPTDGWSASVVELESQLRQRPILDAAAMDALRASSSDVIQLQLATGPVRVPARGAVPMDDAEALGSATASMSRAARFAQAVEPCVVAAVAGEPAATFRYDPTATRAQEEARAAAVPDAIARTPAGAIIVRRGDSVTPTQLGLLQAEARLFMDHGPAASIWMHRLGLAAVVLAITAGVSGYVGLYAPRIRRNPRRMLALGVLMLGGLLAACLATAELPEFRAVTVLAPAVFVAAVVAIAYEGRMALAIGSLEALLIGIALREPTPMLAAVLAGVSVSAWQLSDLRDRRSLVRAGLTIGAVLAVAYAGALLVLPPSAKPQGVMPVLGGAALASLAGVLVMGVTLFILPVLERQFDITTGMTLIELRDPKQPLLRELQRRAPGTYNHSLNVASIAEQAAEAIGADSLLTYAGVLYHDIGKMNKPEYFVENQSGGVSKHDKLSPAMSLLVIVGHVKDGLELAREFGLPRALHHFIEAHHGTTLVEYFYERARKNAEQQAADGAHDSRPAEIEYRYPGPKPQSREVAIVMIADAVESATRTLPDPTPSRIEGLVHNIARKRLEDGQFDECGLTLKDLHVITESIAKSVTAIYHGRIAYPERASASP